MSAGACSLLGGRPAKCKIFTRSPLQILYCSACFSVNAFRVPISEPQVSADAALPDAWADSSFGCLSICWKRHFQIPDLLQNTPSAEMLRCKASVLSQGQMSAGLSRWKCWNATNWNSAIVWLLLCCFKCLCLLKCLLLVNIWLGVKCSLSLSKYKREETGAAVGWSCNWVSRSLTRYGNQQQWFFIGRLGKLLVAFRAGMFLALFSWLLVVMWLCWASLYT